MKALVENVKLNGKRTNVLVEGSTIASIGKEKDRSGVVIDGSKLAIIPGFVNCHAHAAMSLLRGYADDFPLREWLEKYIWPREAKLSKKDVYWGSKLACLEMIKSGTTCFADMYFHSRETARAVKESGIRGFLSEVFIGTKEFDSGKASHRARELKKFGPRVTPMLGPHSMYTVSKENLSRIAEEAEKEDLFIHFHLSETEKEVKDCEREHGKRPVEWLAEIGFLSKRVLSAHCTWVNEKEARIMAEKGVKAVHCPVSNMKLAVGRAMPYSQLRKAGVSVCLGTDGCASNNNLSMLEEMKFASLMQKFSNSDPTALPAREALFIATEAGARALGLNAGRIEEGMLADFSLVNLKSVSLTPGHSLESDLVYSAGVSSINTVFCNGEIVMQNRAVKSEAEILEKAREQALDWVSR